MAKPLDGIALSSYTRRLKFSKETQELLKGIRQSPPSRTPEARKGNMPVWYPSKKMQCIIKAESHKVEFAFLLAAEHDDDVLEVWDQPPSIPLEYPDKRGRLQRPLHTPDYFVFRYQKCGWIECKPAQELVKLAEKRPHRYILENGIWRCPPGEEFAAKYGLTYGVWSLVHSPNLCSFLPSIFAFCPEFVLRGLKLRENCSFFVVLLDKKREIRLIWSFSENVCLYLLPLSCCEFP